MHDKPWPIPQPMTPEQAAEMVVEDFMSGGVNRTHTGRVKLNDVDALHAVLNLRDVVITWATLVINVVTDPSEGEAGVRSEIAEAVREWADKLEGLDG